MSEPQPPLPPATAAKVEIVREAGEVTLVYETAAFRVEVVRRGRTLTIPHSTLHAQGATGELDRIADAWWGLAAAAEIDCIEIAYRMGDPYETYQLRPVVE
jgi:hypothetical protein